MPNQYKARLAMLGLTQTAILPRVRELLRMPVNVTELSAALNGVGAQRKHDRIREAVETLLTELEAKQKEVTTENA